MPQREGEYSNCWLTAIQLADDCPVRPLDIMEALEQDDVESRPIWKPMHLQPVFAKYDFISDKEDIQSIDRVTGADSSVSGIIFKRGVCMPSDSKMTEDDLSRVCGVVKGMW